MSSPGDALLQVHGLKVHYGLPRAGLFRRGPTVRAVDGVTFDVRQGTTFGIVGESGCGKSTTALATLRLVKSTDGSIRFDGQEIRSADERTMRALRRRMQIIFQDPYSSLNPRDRAGEIVDEPLRLLTTLDAPQRRARVAEIFERVGLRPEQAKLFPHQFSGGQRQRIGIARALAARPDLIVCDEPVSALDVAIQAQILNLLIRLQDELKLTYLFISHDLAVVQYLCDEIAVMYLGRIVERADRRSLFLRPLHPYTIALLSADPIKDPAERGAKAIQLLKGDAPSPINPPTGCHFHTRCPHTQERCRGDAPALREVAGGHRVACHFVGDDGQAPWSDGTVGVSQQGSAPLPA
ncbi:MAG: ABC transporter ATP-binding protein [Lautropia sp.]